MTNRITNNETPDQDNRAGVDQVFVNDNVLYRSALSGSLRTVRIAVVTSSRPKFGLSLAEIHTYPEKLGQLTLVEPLFLQR